MSKASFWMCIILSDNVGYAIDADDDDDLGGLQMGLEGVFLITK